MTRVLETVLTGRNLLSPVLASAGKDVVAFNSTVAGANEKAAAGAAASARVQQASATSSAAASGKAATASTVGAGTQSAAADKIAASNVKASTSASTSAQQQMAAHRRAAESATVQSRVQQSANMALARSNGLLGTSLTPLTAGVGATALAFGYGAYRGMEFGTAMSRVQAATQATSGDMGRLREAAIEMGADTQFSSVEAAAGITEMAKAGVSTTNIIRGGLKGALDLAAAGEMEVADAAEIGATALNVFNLRGNQMGHVADLLAAGAGKAQGSVHDLGMALNQSALVASATGVSIEETTGTLAMFASAGLIGSDAGTSFRSMLLHLQNPSKEAAGVMADLGVNMYDANGAFVGMESLAGQLQTQMRGLTQAERDKAMATIFGSDAVRAANVLYEQGARGIDQWTGKVNDAGYASRQAAQLTDNLGGDLEKLGGSVDSFFTNLGEGTQGPLREAVQMLTFLVNTGGDVLGFFNSLPGPVQAALAGVAAFVAFRGPLGAFLTTLHEKAVMGAVSLLDVAQSADKARTAFAGLTSAAAGLAVAWALGKAVGEIVSFTQAGDSAKEMVDALDDSLEGIEGPARLEANGAAIKQLRNELEDYQAIVDAYFKQGWFDEVIWQNPFEDLTDIKDAKEAIDVLQAKIKELEGATGEATGAFPALDKAIAATVTQTEEAIKAHEDWIEQLRGVGEAFVEPLGVYTGLLEEKTTAEREAAEKTAASTESSSDSWKDYVGEVDVSLDELATRLEEQLLAQDNWRANIATITQRGGLEVGEALAAMGEEGVELAALMANGTDAEFDRMARLIVEDTRRGGAGAAAELDKAMKIMATVGSAGGKSTVQGIASQLKLGADEVRSIAAQYGLNLAEGINPLLVGLGKPRVKPPINGQRRPDFYDGGYTGDGDKYDPAGVVHKGEFVLTKEQTARLGIDRIEEFANRGYANGGFVTAADVPRPRSTAPYGPPISTAGDATMQRGFDEVRAWLTANVGAAGAGAVGGTWGSLWSLVKAQIPQARMNSTYRPGDPGYHGRGKAIDFGFGSGPGGAGSAGLASINRLLHDQVGRNLAELIYDGIGDDRPDLKNGRPLTYSASTRAQHHNHVHAAVADTGGVMAPGTAHLNLSGRPERTLDPRQTEAFERWMTSPASMPGYGYGYGGHGDRPGTTKVEVSLQGASITGRLELGTDGLVTLVDGRITDVLTYAGTAAS